MSSCLREGTAPNTYPNPMPDEQPLEGELFLYKYDVTIPEGGETVPHCTLVVKFCTNFYVTIEGIPDKDFTLQGNYEESCHPPPGKPNRLDRFFFDTSAVSGVLPTTSSPHGTKMTFPQLLKVKLSPRTLLEIARTNPENGRTFCACASDGQSWAESAVRAMEPFAVEIKRSRSSCTVS